MKMFSETILGNGKYLGVHAFWTLENQKKRALIIFVTYHEIFSLFFSHYFIDYRDETTKNDFFEMNNEKIRSPESN